ncbi:TolC family protein [Bdellovibrionota bacterium FG-1]
MNWPYRSLISALMVFALTAQAQPRAPLPTPQPAQKLGAEPLTLEKAIKRAVANNRPMQAQRLSLRSSEIGYDNAWDQMFMPGIALRLNSTSTYTVGHLPGDLHTAQGNATDLHGYPASSAGLTLGSYTLFNFWRDWNAYEQARLDWTRTKEMFSESVRQLRFQVTTQFFTLKIEQEKVDAGKRSVDIAEAIVELVKSRVKKGSATESDVSSATVDLLNSQNDLGSRMTAAKMALWTLNQTLGDPIDTLYAVQGAIQFVPLKLTPDQALKIYMDQSPSMKNAKKDLKKADLSVEVAEKSQLPLPTISFSGITVGYTNGYYGSGHEYTSGSGVNLDVSAGISLSIPILGPGGFLGSRNVESARISRTQTELNYQETGNRDAVNIYNAIYRIQRTEEAIANNKQTFERSTALLDSLVGKLSSETTSRLEIRDAINQARSSEIQLLDTNLGHLNDKLGLAALIGLDHLPGDPY